MIRAAVAELQCRKLSGCLKGMSDYLRFKIANNLVMQQEFSGKTYINRHQPAV